MIDCEVKKQSALRDLTSITHELFNSQLPKCKLNLLLLWHDLWGKFTNDNLNLIEVFRLSGALDGLNQAMLAQSMLSSRAMLRLQYWLHSMTDFHITRQKNDSVMQMANSIGFVTSHRSYELNA